MKKCIFLCLLLIFTLNENTYGNPLVIYIVNLEKWGERNDVSGEIYGIYPEIYKEFARRSEIDFKLVLAPYPRVIRALASGECDLTTTLPAEDFIHTFETGELIWEIQIGIVSLRENPIDAYSQLTGKNVGIIRGAAITPEFDRDSSINKVSSVRFSNLIEMLYKRRIDAIAGDIGLIQTITQNDPVKAELLAEPLYLTSLPLVALMSRKSEYLSRFEEFNQIFADLKDEGIIESIVYSFLIDE